MSLIDAPMALVDRLLGRAAGVPSDDPALRRIDRFLRSLDPSPDYRERLRGRMLNRYVAAVEGLDRPEPRRREMGRIGRTVLHASLALAISVGAAAAAAQHSLPGDVLYPVKLQIAEMRLQVAPASARPHLLALALTERMAELEALAEAGRWGLASAAAGRVLAAGERLVAAGGVVGTVDSMRIQHHLEVLESLLASAPEAARRGLERALERSDSTTRSQPPAQTGDDAAGPARGGSQGRGSLGATAEPEPTVQPAVEPTPRPTPKASRDPKATPEPSASETATPEPEGMEPEAAPEP